MRPIGYYVHHHGHGHRDRFRAVAAATTLPLVPISELAMAGGVRLPSDVPAVVVDPTAGGSLHWAPLDRGLRQRSAALVSWLADADPRGVVVDVSVETALTCRLAGVPTVVVRQHGDRTDGAHDLAYRSAVRLLAPFPEALEHPATPPGVIARTDYAGFVAAPAAAPAAVPGAEATRRPPDRPRPGPDDVVVLWGSGGGRLDGRDVGRLAASVAGRVHLVGTGHRVGERVDRDRRVVHHGWVDRPSVLLAERPVVVAAAGNGSVALAAAHGCPLVVVPQERPFAEQRRHAEVLDLAGVAMVAGARSARDWRRLIAGSRERAPRLAALATPDGAERAAASIGRWLA